jgi:anti-sigma factor RsiW
MRFLDGELPVEERLRVEAALARSTELRRELAIFRAMKEDFHGLSFSPTNVTGSIWQQVHLRLTRPIGWLLLVVGAVIWIAYGSYVYLNAAIHPIEKLATAAIVLGIVALLTTVIYERYRSWLADPYKDVQR